MEEEKSEEPKTNLRHLQFLKNSGNHIVESDGLEDDDFFYEEPRDEELSDGQGADGD